MAERKNGLAHLCLTDGGVCAGQLQSPLLTHELHLRQDGQRTVIVTCQAGFK